MILSMTDCASFRFFCCRLSFFSISFIILLIATLADVNALFIFGLLADDSTENYGSAAAVSRGACAYYARVVDTKVHWRHRRGVSIDYD